MSILKGSVRNTGAQALGQIPITRNDPAKGRNWGMGIKYSLNYPFDPHPRRRHTRAR